MLSVHIREAMHSHTHLHMQAHVVAPAPTPSHPYRCTRKRVMKGAADANDANEMSPLRPMSLNQHSKFYEVLF